MMWDEAKIRDTQLGFAKAVCLLLPVRLFDTVFIMCNARPKWPVHVEQQNSTGVAACPFLINKQLFVYCETIPFTSETVNNQQTSRFCQALFPNTRSRGCYAHWTLYIRQCKQIAVSELENSSCACGRTETWLLWLLSWALHRSVFSPSRLSRFTLYALTTMLEIFHFQSRCFEEENNFCPCR